MHVLFNPRCSKCRMLQRAFDTNDVEWEQKRYLEEQLEPAEIDEIFAAYDGDWKDLLRTKEPAFRENGISIKEMTVEEAKGLIALHPVVLQRPIVLKDGRAYIARDDKTLSWLLEQQ